MVAGGPGWIMAGTDAPPPGPNPERIVPAIWTSIDGVSWDRSVIDMPADLQDGGLELLAVGPSGMVAAGAVYPPGGGGNSTAVWSSIDGRAWSVLGTGSRLDFGSCEKGCPAFTALGTSGSRVIVLGYRYDAAGETFEAHSWTISGGGAWQQATLPAGGGSTHVAPEMSVMATPAGFLVAGSICEADGRTCRAVTWSSADGLAWAGPTDLPGGAGCGVLRVVNGSGHAVILGQRCVEGCTFEAWTSADLRTWAKSDLDRAVVHSPEYGLITFAGGRFLVIGSRADVVEVWGSTDGAAWRQVGLTTPFAPAHELLLADLAARPDAVLAVGVGPNEAAGSWTSP